MIVRLLLFVTLISLFTISCAKSTTDFTSGEWIDLSYDFSDKTIYWTEADGF